MKNKTKSDKQIVNNLVAAYKSDLGIAIKRAFELAEIPFPLVEDVIANGKSIKEKADDKFLEQWQYKGETILDVTWKGLGYKITIHPEKLKQG